MANQTPEEELFTFTDRQKRIYQKLQLIGEGIPVYFKDACRLQNVRRPFETTTHLVGHLMREIESSIRSVLRIVEDSSSPSSSEVSDDRTSRIAAIIEEFPELELKPGESHKAQIRQILKGLEIEDNELVGELWIETAPKHAHSWAHRDNLDFPRPVDPAFIKYLDKMETVFDVLLPRFESKYSAVHAALEPILLKQDPKRVDAKWLKTKVPNNRPGRGYFFNNVENPKWLWPLDAEGLFDHPPEPQFDEETGFTTFPTWPASQYLVRMANHDAVDIKAKVANILKKVESSNYVVHLDILEAACSLPRLSEKVGAFSIL